MELIGRYFELLSRYGLEPALFWVLNHPFVSIIAVFVIVYFSVRNYRML